MKHALAIVSLLCAAVAAVSALAQPPAAAAAKAPCWKELINDWYDGRIDKTYPAECYREAQKRIPRDAELYSSLPDDLQRALASVAGRSGGPPNGSTPIEPIPGLGRDPEPAGSGGEETPTGAPNNDDKGEAFLDNFAPANADSIPIPLLVLAALAVLLLATAIASYAARRLQARRVPVTASSRRPPDA